MKHIWIVSIDYLYVYQNSCFVEEFFFYFKLFDIFTPSREYIILFIVKVYFFYPLVQNLFLFNWKALSKLRSNGGIHGIEYEVVTQRDNEMYWWYL